MLIVKRREGESLVIESTQGERVTVCVAEIRTKGHIAIGIEAPQTQTVARGELVEPKRPAAPARRTTGKPPAITYKNRR